MTRPQVDQTVGKVFGRLTVEAYEGPNHRGDGQWRCHCECGEATVVVGYRLRSGRTQSCGCFHRERQVEMGRQRTEQIRELHPPVGTKYKEVVGYEAAHARVRVAYGKASEHPCQCGAQAEEWAYDHTDPMALRVEKSFRGRLCTVSYSLDVDRYIPLCKACHTKFDRVMS